MQDQDAQAEGLLRNDIHIQATYRLTEALVASEKRMRRRIELLSEVVFETCPDGKLTFLNRAWSHILGHELASSLNVALRDFVVEEDRPLLDRTLTRTSDHFNSDWPQIRLRRADGSILWMELAATALEEGGAVGALHDITQQKMAQAELAKLSLVASFTDNLVIITDGKGRIEWVNDAFVRKTGYSLPEARGCTPGALLQGPGTDPQTVKFIRERLREDRSFQCEILNYTRSGEEYWLAIHISPIFNARGEVERYISIQTDTTELRRAQQDLRAAKEAAESASEAKTQFLATISHEMRTPLNAILGTAEMALECAAGGIQQHYLTRINENAEALLGLISDLLDVSKIEAGQFDWERTRFNLSDCLKQALAPAAERSAGKGLNFELNFDAERLPTHLLGDPGRLRQIVANLAENAVKFTERGFVHVGVTRTDSSLDIRVADSGAGIPASAQGKIFERFFQGDGSTTRRKGGAGLGLNIVQSLVHAAGGTVGIDSAPGRGTQFRALIPLGPQSSPNPWTPEPDTAAEFRLAAHEEEIVAAREVHAARSAPMRAASVLVGEDHDDNFAIVERHLVNAGYMVERASDGKLAVDAVRRRHYDLVLMDVEMPEMDGLEATRAIRGIEVREGRPHVPIIALTAHAIKGYRSRCLQAGCNSYLAKPIRKQALLEAVEAALELR